MCVCVCVLGLAMFDFTLYSPAVKILVRVLAASGISYCPLTGIHRRKYLTEVDKKWISFEKIQVKREQLRVLLCILLFYYYDNLRQTYYLNTIIYKVENR